MNQSTDNFKNTGMAVHVLVECLDELDFLAQNGRAHPGSVAVSEQSQDLTFARSSIPWWPTPVTTTYDAAIRCLALSHDHLIGLRDLFRVETAGTASVLTQCRAVVEASGGARWVLSPQAVGARVGRGLATCEWALKYSARVDALVQSDASSSRHAGDRVCQRISALQRLGHLLGLAEWRTSGQRRVTRWLEPRPSSTDLVRASLETPIGRIHGVVYPLLSESAHGNPDLVSRLIGCPMWIENEANYFAGHRSGEHRQVSALALLAGHAFVDALRLAIELTQGADSNDHHKLSSCWVGVQDQLLAA